MSNKDIYKLNNVVKFYLKNHDLLVPEQTIIDLFKDRWKHWRVLDIGIGAGRTTTHFAPISKEYVGIDYSEGMVETCKKTFGNFGANVVFQLGDVRALLEYETGTFDFVMFSYNGLDSISYEERLTALKEMKRVGKKGGYLFFSSHNLQYMPNMYKIRHNRSLSFLAYRFYRSARLLYHNGWPGKFKNRDYAMIKDDANHFRLEHCYTKPALILAQLKEIGLKNIRVFPSRSAGELNVATLDAVSEYGWLHFLGEI